MALAHVGRPTESWPGPTRRQDREPVQILRGDATGNMTEDPLLAAIRAVPMLCANCGKKTTDEGGPYRDPRPCSESLGLHVWETDDAAITQAVRAWLRSVEPSDEQFVTGLWFWLAPSAMDAIRALYRRAWSAGEAP